MSDLTVVPLLRADRNELEALLDAEERAWQSELGWDYGPIRRILARLLERGILSGLAAIERGRLAAYLTFAIRRERGIFGSIFRRPDAVRNGAVHAVVGAAVASLVGSKEVHRVEAQIVPVQDLDLEAVFASHRFERHGRCYLELQLKRAGLEQPRAPAELEQLNLDALDDAAEVIVRAYEKSIDAHICDDYATMEGSRDYLRSLIESPGCGTWLPQASFLARERGGRPCGLAVTSRIAPGAAMLAQIAVAPEAQGRGVGRALMSRALQEAGALGARTMALTVTEENRRAHAWYRRAGFELKKTFGAYCWRR